jgi:hypothetical protein
MATQDDRGIVRRRISTGASSSLIWSMLSMRIAASGTEAPRSRFWRTRRLYVVSRKTTRTRAL